MFLILFPSSIGNFVLKVSSKISSPNSTTISKSSLCSSKLFISISSSNLFSSFKQSYALAYKLFINIGSTTLKETSLYIPP